MAEQGMLDEATHYRFLKLLQENPDLTQRDLAKVTGISLGKVNYCLKALIERGLVEVAGFRNAPNKKVYAYLLTPKGIEEKARLTVRFLRRKQEEYEAIKRELEMLQQEAKVLGPNHDGYV